MIKNILAFLGGVFVLLMIFTLAAYLQWGSLQKNAQIFASDSAVAMFQTWDFAALKTRAAPMMFANTTEDNVRDVFKAFSKLGKMQTIEGCQGQASLNLGNTKEQPPVTGQYGCKIKFENDTAVVRLLLIGDYFNNWKIGAMQMNSDYLVKVANQGSGDKPAEASPAAGDDDKKSNDKKKD